MSEEGLLILEGGGVVVRGSRAEALLLLQLHSRSSGAQVVIPETKGKGVSVAKGLQEGGGGVVELMTDK